MTSRERESTTIGALLAKYGGSVKTGPFGTALKAKEYSKDGVYLISVGEIGYGTFRISDSTPRVPKEVTDRLPEYLLQTNDIVFGRKGGVDRSAIIKPEQSGWFLGSDGIRLRLPETCSADFIAYQLQSVSSRDWIIQHATGTTMASLNQEVISRIPIILPPIDEQRRIAQILGTLDDKIELNRQLNATLEQMARTLFQSWFVDFDPVRAKAIGELEESICRRLGLTPELLALFPAALEDSVIGEIPVGWEVKTVEELAKRIAMGPFGSSIKVSTFVSDGVPVISGQHLRTFILEDSTFNFVTEEHAEKLNKAAVYKGDIVFTHAGNIGQVALIPDGSKYDKYILSQRQFFLRPDSTLISANYLVYHFNSSVGQHQILANASSSGVPSIARPVSYLRSIKVLSPAKIILDEFDSLITPIHALIEENRAEIKTLSSLRDELLPKLLSGDIRLK
ncbi:restriction endonuclease subunit S [Fibrella aquatica]|uniref:restriction endonuclease subunit S n=1 Tax=Fibrella aquatica TaxID=3242487 RepID=UPI0035204FE2